MVERFHGKRRSLLYTNVLGKMQIRASAKPREPVSYKCDTVHPYMKLRVPSLSGTFRSSSSRPLAITRHSTGLDQFYAAMTSVQGLSLLDLSGVSQANITFVTEGGHRLSSDDIVGAMLQNFGENFEEGQRSEENAARFLENTLTFPQNSFDGALAWDVFQFLTPPLVEQMVGKLLRVVRPGGLILAFFNADGKAKEIPLFSYKIQDSRTLQQTPRGGTQKVQPFLHRTIEKLFASASSVQFFLTRDHLYEVLVRR